VHLAVRRGGKDQWRWEDLVLAVEAEEGHEIPGQGSGDGKASEAQPAVVFIFLKKRHLKVARLVNCEETASLKSSFLSPPHNEKNF